MSANDTAGGAALPQLTVDARVDGAAGIQTALPLLLDVPAAGRELGGLSRAELYRLLEAGELERVHIGSGRTRVRITSRSVLAYVARQLAAERGQLPPLVAP